MTPRTWRTRVARWLRPGNWSLRAKLAALMVLGSAVPVIVSTTVDAMDIREHALADAKSVLEARAEQLAAEMDRVHGGYLTAMTRAAQIAPMRQFCANRPADTASMVDLLRTFPTSDPAILGAGVISAQGEVVLATDEVLKSIPTAGQRAVLAALAGERSVSDIGMPIPGERIDAAGYFAPVRALDGRVVCVVALWVRATPFWEGLRAAAGKAGPDSYAVLYDALGVRIGHTFDDANLYRPAAPLEPAVIEREVAEGRLGLRTRQILSDAKPFPEQFARARDFSPDRAVFSGQSPATNTAVLGVARRLRTVPWTVFFMAPEAAVQRAVGRQVRQKVLLSGAIIAIAALVGAFFASGLLWPIRRLQEATERLAASPDARVPPHGHDELGQLGASFNAMAERLQAQEQALREANERLSRTVDERTSALRDQSNLLASTIDAIGAAVYVKDAQGRFILVNDYFLGIFGLPRADVIGQTDHALMTAGAAETVRATDARVMQMDKPLVVEEHVPNITGVRSYLSVKSQYRDSEGRVIGIIGVSTDVTEQLKARQRQREQLERMSMLDQMTTSIAQRDDLGSIHRVLTASLEERMPVAFACVLSVPAQRPGVLEVEGLGDSGSRHAHEMGFGNGLQIPVGQNGLARCLQGTLVYEPDISQLRHGFAERLARGGLRSVVLVPLMSEGQANGILLVAREAADAFDSGDCEFLRQLGDHVSLAAHQARLYEQLRSAYDELQATQQQALQSERLRALGEMASGIAHDINNALSPVSVYAEALLTREGGLSEKARHYLQVIVRGIDDVVATVARMREFYRADSDAAPREEIDLSEVARQAVDLTEARWRDLPQKEGRSIDLRAEFPAQAVTVQAVPSEMREALVNLIFNAVDAMPAGGVITVSTGIDTFADAPPAPWLEVRDTGHGMDEATLRRCMEPFFTTKGRRGTGLGLAMVYGIAQRHGAHVEIDSAPGEGTAVRLVFGAARPTGGPSHVPEADASVPAPLHVLAVDDDPQVLESLRLLLEMDGHRVTCCEGGARGLELLASPAAGGGPFDVLITDLGMPGVGGLEVAAAAKAVSPPLPVILLTGWGQRLIEEDQATPHVNVVMGKPPKLRALRSALHQARPDRVPEPPLPKS